MLASRGYAVLSLPFFDFEDLPPVPDTLELEYFEEAVEFVIRQENVIPDRCGMISVSKSTDIALLLSTKVPALTAVLCIGVVSVSYDTNLTYKGKLVAEGVKIGIEHIQMDEKGRMMPDPKFIEGFSAVDKDAVTLHLEEASPDTHYLVVAGSEDSWLCYLCVTDLLNYMTRHNRSDKIEGVIYPNAGHLIEPPYGPLIHSSYQRILPIHKGNVENVPATNGGDDASQEEIPGKSGGGDKESYIRGIPIVFGGQPKETCDAQVDLWSKMQSFFNLRVRDGSPYYQNYLKTSKRTSPYEKV